MKEQLTQAQVLQIQRIKRIIKLTKFVKTQITDKRQPTEDREKYERQAIKDLEKHERQAKEDIGVDDSGIGITDITDEIDNKTNEIYRDSNNRDW